jgi:hypothetical protein
MDIEPAPSEGDWRDKPTSTSPGWIEGSYPRTDLRLDASPGWPNHSLLSTASYISAPRQESCSVACPSLRGASSFKTYTREHAATTHSRGQCVPPRLLLAHRGHRRQRDRAHLRGVPVLRPQVQPPCARLADHPRHMALCCVGAGHRRAFGVPNSIITDNGSQFTGRKFLEFCDKFHIRVDWAAVAHPRTNG